MVYTGYDEEARYFEVGVRGDKRAELLASLHAAVRPLYDSQLSALRSLCLEGFKQDVAARAEGTNAFASLAAG